VVVPLPSTAADNLDQENVEPLESVDEPVITALEQSQLHSVSMPVKKCKRGRPKGTDKSLNVKFGTKRRSRSKPLQKQDQPMLRLLLFTLKSQVMPHTLSCLYRNDRQLVQDYRRA